MIQLKRFRILSFLLIIFVIAPLHSQARYFHKGCKQFLANIHKTREELRDAWNAYDESRDAYDKSMDAYDESGKSYDEVLKANKNFYQAYDKVNNETIKARESRDKALKTRDNGYEALKSLQAFQSTNNALQSWKTYNEAYKEAMDTKEANNEIIKAYDEALKDYKESYEILVKNRDNVFKKESIYWLKLNKSVNVILESLETAIDEFNIKVSKKPLMKILNQYIDTDTYISNKVYKSYYKAWTTNNEAWTAWYEARTANNEASKANDETFKSLIQAYDTAKNYWYEASKSRNSWEPWEAVFKKYSKSLQEAYDAHSKYSQAWDESWKVWDESFKTRNEASKAYDEAWHSLLELHKKNQKAIFSKVKKFLRKSKKIVKLLRKEPESRELVQEILKTYTIIEEF